MWWIKMTSRISIIYDSDIQERVFRLRKDYEYEELIDTVLTLTPSSSTISFGEMITVTGTLKDISNNPLSNQTVNILRNNVVIGTEITGSDGGFSYEISGLTVGNHSLRADYSGNEVYDNSSSNNVTVTVTEPVHNYAIAMQSTKDILSYADSESATITSTLTDNGVAVSGETLSYVIKHNNTTIDTGSDTTDSSGQISFNYTATGIGDVTIEVNYQSVTETFVIQDCSFYSIDGTGLTGTYTTGDGYITNMGGDTGLSSFTFPSNFEITYKYYPTNNGTETSNNLLWLIGASKNNGVLIGSEKTNYRNRIYNRTNSNQVQQTQDNINVVNSWNEIKITYNNGVWSILTGNGTAISYSKTFTPVMMLTYESYLNARLKEFKIKAL